MNFVVAGLKLKESDCVFVGEEAVKNAEKYPMEEVTVYISEEEIEKLYKRMQGEKEAE